ncbi:hypothetical protein N483_08255 [Pseudoalteromonas luteoviolacea NCIMB 1944]|nr:hypothetical protein N483_08255 [Pseudoalteromonas luteoviolacea NCIMB 1944]
MLARQIMAVTNADTPLSQYPVIKADYQGSSPKSSTKFADDFCEELDAPNQAYGSYKRARELGDNKKASGYF